MRRVVPASSLARLISLDSGKAVGREGAQYGNCARNRAYPGEAATIPVAEWFVLRFHYPPILFSDPTTGLWQL